MISRNPHKSIDILRGGALMYRFGTSFTWLNAHYEYIRTIIIEITIHKKISILAIAISFIRFPQSTSSRLVNDIMFWWNCCTSFLFRKQIHRNEYLNQPTRWLNSTQIQNVWLFQIVQMFTLSLASRIVLSIIIFK